MNLVGYDQAAFYAIVADGVPVHGAVALHGGNALLAKSHPFADETDSTGLSSSYARPTLM